MSANEALDYKKLKEGNERDLNEWKTLFLTSVIFAVPIVIINMIIPLISNDLKIALEEHIVPRVTYKTCFLFILSTPVQFCIGYRFHRAAIRGIKHGNLGMDFGFPGNKCILLLLGVFRFPCVYVQRISRTTLF